MAFRKGQPDKNPYNGEASSERKNLAPTPNANLPSFLNGSSDLLLVVEVRGGIG